MHASHTATFDALSRQAMEPFWLPFTPNRQFKDKPRLFVAAEGMHYVTQDGRRSLDAMAGLWCVNAGHGQRPIVEAIKAQAERLSYAHTAVFTTEPAESARASRTRDTWLRRRTR